MAEQREGSLKSFIEWYEKNYEQGLMICDDNKWDICHASWMAGIEWYKQTIEEQK